VSASIAILDYGMGNRRSVEKAFERVGARPLLTRARPDVEAADGLVLPGVGAFPEAMRRLRELELDALLRERAEAGAPILGICLGMQLLFDSSTENDGAQGLGLLPGAVDRIESGGMKLPHIGWSLVRWQHDSPLTAGLPDECAFYHVHTYAPQPADTSDVLGVAEYARPFVAAVAHDPLFGVQFHPEKSSRHGLRLLENFAAISARVAA
jgi:glutamine amidotransferase